MINPGVIEKLSLKVRDLYEYVQRRTEVLLYRIIRKGVESV